MTPDPAQVAAQITELSWDDGNATGLDGWIGPGRGAGDVDYEAERARARSEAKVTEVVRAVLEAAWDAGLRHGCSDTWNYEDDNPYAADRIEKEQA
ncbi:hypothetical protein IEE94_11135 [Yimella sp. cx-573]|nr:hypothetical protein [Yimella sp. cx-573]